MVENAEVFVSTNHFWFGLITEQIRDGAARSPTLNSLSLTHPRARARHHVKPGASINNFQFLIRPSAVWQATVAGVIKQASINVALFPLQISIIFFRFSSHSPNDFTILSSSCCCCCKRLTRARREKQCWGKINVYKRTTHESFSFPLLGFRLGAALRLQNLASSIDD
jgi:hypothetical protein